MDQTTLWANQTAPQANKTPDCYCQVCRHCSALEEPREIEGNGGEEAYIYGYCFKGGTKTYSPNMGKGFPIYIPLDSGATCEDFKRRRTPDGH